MRLSRPSSIVLAVALACAWAATAVAAPRQGVEAATSQVQPAQPPQKDQPEAPAPKPPARPAPPQPDGLTPLDLQGQTGQVTSGTAFNPAMSVIPDMAYYNDDRSGEAPELLSMADGFRRGGDEEHGSHGSELSPGFNLRELELSFSASVDPYFDAMAILAVGGDGVELEEVYARTRRLPAGLQLKAGKFYSEIGYINRQHPHQWSFVDQNLAHELVLGGALNEIGLQLTYLPALPVYLQLGVEALQGENPAMASYLGGDPDHPEFTKAAGPRLFTAFGKLSPDLGDNTALQVGGFLARSRQHQEEQPDGPYQGHAWLYGFEAVCKFDSPKPYGKNDLVIQSEYLRRQKDLAPASTSEAGCDCVASPGERVFNQDGLYVQGTYGFASRWTAGLRFDIAGLTNSVEEVTGPLADYGSSRRVSANVTFNPTEFSRLRFQVNRAAIAVDGAREWYTQVFVQLQLSLGVHGAHTF